MRQEEDDYLATGLFTDLDAHFKQLVEIYQHGLYRLIYRQTSCEQDAEDIVQETFVRAYYALRDYAAQGKRLQHIQAWLYKIAFRLYYNRVRTAKPLLVPGEPGLQDLEHPDPGPEELADRSESLHEILEVVSALPEPYKSALNLHYFAEFSYQEIADLLHQPLGTIRSHVSRGLRLVRAKLNVVNSTVEDRRIV